MRTRIYYTKKHRDLIWDKWQQGYSLEDIARSFDRYHSSIQRIIYESGGIRPRERSRSKLALTLAEREEISRGLASKESFRSIAFRLNRSPSTISREVKRNGGHTHYRAAKSDSSAWERALRPKEANFHLIKNSLMQ